MPSSSVEALASAADGDVTVSRRRGERLLGRLGLERVGAEGAAVARDRRLPRPFQDAEQAASAFVRGEAGPPCTVTAEYAVKLLRPTPMDGPIRLRARVAESAADRAVVEASMEAGGKVTATCRGTFVAVKPGHPAFQRW